MAAQKGKGPAFEGRQHGNGQLHDGRGAEVARDLVQHRGGGRDARRVGRQWRELLEGAGAKSARVTGAGIFKDAASDATVRSYVFNGTIRAWQIVIPDFGTIEGPFQIGSFELIGRHDGEVGFEIALESAGELVFTAI